MFKLISSAAAVVGALAAFTSTATAGESAKVDLSDLDLSRAEDVATFDARATRAAKRHCRSSALDTGSFSRDVAGCTKQVRAQMEQSLPAAQRTALAATRARGAAPVLAAR